MNEDERQELLKDFIAALSRPAVEVQPVSPEGIEWMRQMETRKQDSLEKERTANLAYNAEMLELHKIKHTHEETELVHIMKYRDRLALAAEAQAKAIDRLAGAVVRAAELAKK